MRKWLENLGERNTRVVRKNKSWGEGNPVRISQSGIIFIISLRSEKDYKKDSQKPLVISFKNLHHHFWGLPLLIFLTLSTSKLGA